MQKKLVATTYNFVTERVTAAFIVIICFSPHSVASCLMLCIVWSRSMWRPSSVSQWPVIGHARTCGSPASSTTRFCATGSVNSRRWLTDRNKMCSICATGCSCHCSFLSVKLQNVRKVNQLKLNLGKMSKECALNCLKVIYLSVKQSFVSWSIMGTPIGVVCSSAS